jgi:hypothetical protein
MRTTAAGAGINSSSFSGTAVESGSAITITRMAGDYDVPKISFTANLSGGTLTVSNWSDQSTKTIFEGVYTKE